MKYYYQVLKKIINLIFFIKELIDNEIKFTNSHYEILCNWLNVGKRVLKKNIKDLTNIIKQQDNYVSNYYANK